jgi:hypothetical protein
MVASPKGLGPESVLARASSIYRPKRQNKLRKQINVKFNGISSSDENK